MEALSIESLISVTTGGGFVALLYITLKFFGSSQKDATEAALTMYRDINEQCKKCEAERDAAKADLANERAQTNALKLKIVGLEREIAQLRGSSSWLLDKFDE